MRRRTLLVELVVAALAVAVTIPATAKAAASPPAVSVVGKFAPFLPWLRARSPVPVLIPGRARLGFGAKHLYPTATVLRKGYDLELGAARDCNGADACFVVAILAQRGAALDGPRDTALAHGLRGHFEPLHCGASCAAPGISWIERGVRYDIQAKLPTPHPRATLVAMADSAIRAGAR